MILRKTIISNAINQLLGQSSRFHEGLCLILETAISNELTNEGYYIKPSIFQEELLKYVIPYHKRWHAILFYKAPIRRFLHHNGYWWTRDKKGYYRRLGYLLALYDKYYDDKTDIISLLLNKNVIEN